MKKDRDANFIEKNADGVTVNRWNTTGFPRLVRRQQRSRLHHGQGPAQPRSRRTRHASTYLTRPHGIQSGSDIWAWCNDQSLGRHQECDLVIVMGGNAAEAHPCGFKWVIEAKKDRKAKLIVVDPRFTRSAAVSDFYAPIRAGSDIAFLGGVINYLLSNDKIHHDYVKNYTNAAS
jgi:anaerobic selenocysteine-containing dehydrogenase